MMQVCHTILLCVDWFIDLDVVRLVRASEMLRTVPIWTSDKFKFKPNRTVNLGWCFILYNGCGKKLVGNLSRVQKFGGEVEVRFIAFYCFIGWCCVVVLSEEFECEV